MLYGAGRDSGEWGGQAHASLRPGTSGRQGLDQGTVGLLRKAPASKTKAAAATAMANDVGEHTALERHWKAGGPRVAREEQARYRVLYCEPSQCLLC